MVKTKRTLKIQSKKGRKNLSKKICAPHRQEESMTCFSKDNLLKLIFAIDKQKTENKIFPNTTKRVIKKMSRPELWKALRSNLKGNCSNERCWKDTYLSKDKQLEAELKPVYPAEWHENSTEWLTTSNIENIVNQFELKYKTFVFIGAVPIDFDDKYNGKCIVNELCNISIKNLFKAKKHLFGCIFNLDEHYKPGSHWVAMFADFKKGHIVYFDSYGYKPNDEISILLKRLKLQNEKRGVPTKIIINTIRHQYENSECGMYCIYFITKMLEGKMDYILNNRIPDKRMVNHRTRYFYKKKLSGL